MRRPAGVEGLAWPALPSSDEANNIYHKTKSAGKLKKDTSASLYLPRGSRAPQASPALSDSDEPDCLLPLWDGVRARERIIVGLPHFSCKLSWEMNRMVAKLSAKL